MEPTLHVRGLSVEYQSARGRLRALRQVDLVIPKGQIVGLVGESGCGKSTLISSIIRLLPDNATVTQGSIELEGQGDLLGLDPEQMRNLRGDRIAMVFQDPMTSLNPVLTIGSQMVDIQFRSTDSRQQKRTHSIEMLRRVGIPDPESRFDQYPHQFSGGMRQRIAIAMALQAEPDLLIADEPTTALDATLEVQILHRLRQLQQRLQCSMLFISHHLGVIAQLCDRVAVMYAGEIVEQGTVRDVFHRPGHPYTRALLECDPANIEERTRVLPTIPGDLPDLADLPPGCIFEARCPDAQQICREAVPESHSMGDSHFAACHLLAEEPE